MSSSLSSARPLLTIQLPDTIPDGVGSVRKLFQGVGKAMPDVREMFETLANGWAVQIWVLKKYKNNLDVSIEGRVQALGPFQLFAAILSEKQIVDNLGTMAGRAVIRLWPFAEDFNVFEKFCKDIQKQREKMESGEWLKEIASLEKVCGVEEGTFGLLETRSFVGTIVDNRDEFHKGVTAAIESCLACDN